MSPRGVARFAPMYRCSCGIVSKSGISCPFNVCERLIGYRKEIMPFACGLQAVVPHVKSIWKPPFFSSCS